MIPLWPVVILCGCTAEAVFIVFEHQKRMLTALVLKAAASLMFILLAVLLAVAGAGCALEAEAADLSSGYTANPVDTSGALTDGGFGRRILTDVDAGN